MKKLLIQDVLHFYQGVWDCFQNRNNLNRKWNYLSHFRPSDQKLLLQDVSYFSKGVSKWFSKQEMDLFKQEMELFLPLPVLWSKNFFNKKFLISTKEFKIDFQNRNRNYLNRKRNYFSHFRASDQKTSFTRCSHFSQGVWDWYSKQEMELLPHSAPSWILS